jgi:uncharacterized membrane protein
MDDVHFYLTVSSALACGLMAGFFFAFSVCIMTALARLPSAQGIAAMQTINIVVINPVFLGVFFGTAVACGVVGVRSLLALDESGAAQTAAGSLLYVGGAILVTMLCNVPRNNALAAVQPDSAGGDQLWADYIRTWTAWNHVRTFACLAAAALLTVAAYRSR